MREPDWGGLNYYWTEVVVNGQPLSVVQGSIRLSLECKVDCVRGVIIAPVGLGCIGGDDSQSRIQALKINPKAPTCPGLIMKDLVLPVNNCVSSSNRICL